MAAQSNALVDTRRVRLPSLISSMGLQVAVGPVTGAQLNVQRVDSCYLLLCRAAVPIPPEEIRFTEGIRGKRYKGGGRRGHPVDVVKARVVSLASHKRRKAHTKGKTWSRN